MKPFDTLTPGTSALGAGLAFYLAALARERGVNTTLVQILASTVRALILATEEGHACLRLNTLIYVLAALDQQVNFGLLGSIFLAELGFGLLLFACSRRLGGSAIRGSTRMSHCAKRICPISNQCSCTKPFKPKRLAAAAAHMRPSSPACLLQPHNLLIDDLMMR